jgi:hypothetical protein
VKRVGGSGGVLVTAATAAGAVTESILNMDMLAEVGRAMDPWPSEPLCSCALEMDSRAERTSSLGSEIAAACSSVSMICDTDSALALKSTSAMSTSPSPAPVATLWSRSDADVAGGKLEGSAPARALEAVRGGKGGAVAMVVVTATGSGD